MNITRIGNELWLNGCHVATIHEGVPASWEFIWHIDNNQLFARKQEIQECMAEVSANASDLLNSIDRLSNLLKKES